MQHLDNVFPNDWKEFVAVERATRGEIQALGGRVW